ncbi:MAG: hypothetical protein J7L15_08830 [Clostridiales bacterium]|nr:hypothetical protein [Clostridiales bacterium]
MKLLDEKIAGLDLTTLFLGGASKYATERFLAPIIGNGTWKSGAIKLVTSIGIQKFMGTNKWVKAIALGLGIDGVEDIMTQFLGSGNILNGFGIGASQEAGVI